MLATFRFHDAVVDFVERSVWSTRNLAASHPRSAREFSQADVAQDCRKEFILSEKLETSKLPHVGQIIDPHLMIYCRSLRKHLYGLAHVTGWEPYDLQI